ncbi:pyruvate kinase [Brachybacterium huguangmaarense]|uniref:Pyruvate kinase n=1 Tax=Brachybacterium huguangmaarense TaxID=1652028 RepID=A0ABY6FZR2_9MICO|nr:pyruvate kinase [Brachybacterium huguangmaarense]UYG16428.1 pyruvate kinase [Brachybacterium huguangmaarense]
MRKAKIVCTLGPATNTYEQIRTLIESGMNVARMNLSHGTYDDHEKVYANIRRAAEDLGRNVAVLVDLQGPKIRLGNFADGPHDLAVGDTFVITTDDIQGTKDRVSTTFKGLPGDCRPGDVLLIDDGKVAVRVTEVSGTDVTTVVEVPGPVSDHKGINLPGVAVSVPAMSEKDIADLRWGINLGADLIALSFVRDAHDMDDVLRIMQEEGKRLPVIAKIEKPQAVRALRQIVGAFDGIMVARGDLGVELPLEQVPIVQKRAIELARRNAKPVIVATQVLESMITSPRPTRAEASDCANAILDGADAVMLSGETSVGAYPFEAVRTMARIITNTEENGADRIAGLGTIPHTRGGAITRAAWEIGDQLSAQYLVTFTESGDTARRLSRLRPSIPLLAITPYEQVRHQLSLSWGIEALLVPLQRDTDEMVRVVDELLRENKGLQPGDLVVIAAGSPPGVHGSTNTLRVHRIGDLDGTESARIEADSIAKPAQS